MNELQLYGVSEEEIGKNAEPEFRLLLSHITYPLSIVGPAIFLALLETSGSNWTIGADTGAAIAAVWNQIVTTVLIA